MIQIREYARLTCDQGQTLSVDVGLVSRNTLDWLMELNATWKGENEPFHVWGKDSLRLGSYVGYLESPSGEAIEILPKTSHELFDTNAQDAGRNLLHRMLLSAMGLKPREAGAANLRRYKQPLHEWVISQFLTKLADLIRRGLRSDYHNIEEESRYIRGSIDMVNQLRQRPDRATWFHIRHDVFSPEIMENRLLATALAYVRRIVKSPDNWRLANELSLIMADIPALPQPESQLQKWRSNKLMASYDAVRPWCQLIIERLNPQFQNGRHQGIALLFPMEMLFEAYVANCLKRLWGKQLTTQASSAYLVQHAPFPEIKSKPWFQLKPDLLLRSDYSTHVMDTKWKLLDGRAVSTKQKYGISQTDMYQLFAYGQKYMDGKGNLALIYPKHSNFSQPLPRFSYSDDLHLWVIPFDLEQEYLVEGEWIQFLSPQAESKDVEMAG